MTDATGTDPTGEAGGQRAARDTTGGGPQRDAAAGSRFETSEVFNGPHSAGASEDVTDHRPSPGGQWPRTVLIAAAVMIGATLFALLLGASGLIAAVVGIGLFLVVLSLIGRSPRAPERIVAAVTGVDRAAVEEALRVAEAHLEDMDATARRLPNREIGHAIADMTEAARDVLDHVAVDPADLNRARKFIKVYIPSAHAALEKYAAFDVADPELELRFRALVDEMTEASARQASILRLDEKTDLEVEMEVLADRLRAESTRSAPVGAAKIRPDPAPPS